ncbi:MAG: tail fiber protein [Actinomycetota bacterium]
MIGRFVRRPLAVVGSLALLLSLLTVSPGAVPAGADIPGPDAFVYLSSTSGGTVDGITFTAGDVLRYDSAADSWAMAFDASAAGLSNPNLNGFSIATDGSYLLTFAQNVVMVPGVGSVDDSDVVAFDPVTGDFTFLLDNSDVELSAGGEDVDAIVTAGPSAYSLSTEGPHNVPAPGGVLAGADEDVITLNATLTGTITAGLFGLFFDGSDAGLNNEDLDAGHYDPTTGTLYWSVNNAFNVGGVSGSGGDVVAFTGTFGDNTSGTHTLAFDASENGWGSETTDALYWELQQPPAPGSADLSITKVDGVDPVLPGQTFAYTVEVINNGPDPAQNVVVVDPLPTGLTLAGTSAECQPVDVLPCSLGTVAAGSSVQFTIDVTVDGGTAGQLSNTATVTSATADPQQGNNDATETTYVGRLPQANDDGPATGSQPGNPFHTDTDTTLASAPNENLLNNDDVGDPAGTISDFEGMTPAGTTGSFPEGDLTVNADGSFTFDPISAFSGLFSFNYRVSNALGSSVATASVYVGPRPVPVNQDLVYVTAPTDGSVAGINYLKSDVMVYNNNGGTWSKFFDGAANGVAPANIDAVAVISDTEVLLSFAGSVTPPGLGSLDDSDVVRFDPTTGTWTRVLVGATIGLTSGGEDIDALDLADNGDFVISTRGNGTVPALGGGNLSARREDAVRLIGGGFEQFFDGSDVDMQQENTVAIHVDEASSTLYGASLNNFNAGGLSGDGNDIWSFTGTTGPNTAGTYGLFLDLDTVGFSDNINGLSLALTPPVTPSIELSKEVRVAGGGYQPADTAQDAPQSTLGAIVDFRLVITNTGDDDLTNVQLSDPTLGISTVTGDIPAGQTVTLDALDIGELSTADFCQAIGTATNSATVTATGALSAAQVSDSDPAVVDCIADTDTTPYGGGGPVLIAQPSLVMQPYIRIDGFLLDLLGEIRWTAADLSDGDEFVKADGRLLNRNDFAGLFTAIGTTFGAGDGVTTFQIPDLRGRAVVGTSNTRPLGSTTGSFETTLTEQNLPAHGHTFTNGFVADPVGGDQSFSVEQPTVALNVEILIQGVPAAGDVLPSNTLSEIRVTANRNGPANGAASATGPLLPISSNQALFALIGNVYGGNATTTFALPDFRDRVVVGLGQGAGLTTRNAGQTIGASTVTLQANNMANHGHLANGQLSSTAGAGAPFSVLQPDMGVRGFIATVGVFPSDADSLGDGSGGPSVAELILMAAPSVNPTGVVGADGATLPIDQNQALFALLGTRYGGDGETIFDVPDLRGRVLVGPGFSALGSLSLGQTFGGETATLIEQNMPTHSHPVSQPPP